MLQLAPSKGLRPIGPEDATYLHALKAFLEGGRDWRDWRSWFAVNRRTLEQCEDRQVVDVLQSYPLMGAIEVLERHRIHWTHTNDYWAYCQICGASMFQAIPGETTQAQIRDFALRSTLEAREEIARSGWIHPGAYCPNGCPGTRWGFSGPVGYPPE